MNYKLLGVAALLSCIALSSYAAQRDPNCVMTLNYSSPQLAAITPNCSWNPAGDTPIQIQVKVTNIPPAVDSVDVNINCNVQGSLKSPYHFFPPIQGKKNFSGEGAKSFPINFSYKNQGPHGNILVYVDDSISQAAINCNGQITIMDQGLE